MTLVPNQVFQKIETAIVTTPKTILCYRTLPLQAYNVALIEDGMATDDDVGTSNDNSTDSIVLPDKKRALQIIERRLLMRKAN